WGAPDCGGLVQWGTPTYRMRMTKRLGMFLGLGFFGVLLLLTGLAWDAVAHAHDPSLAGREGIFNLRNPGHALMGLGIGLVLVSLIGGCETLLASAATGRWARPKVRSAFLTLSTALVVTAAAVTSWAAGGARHPAAGHHDHAQSADPATGGAGGGAHDHDGLDADTSSPAAPGAAPAGHVHPAA